MCAAGTTTWSVTQTESKPMASLSSAARLMFAGLASRRYVGRTTPTLRRCFMPSELETEAQRVSRIDAETVLAGDERGPRQLGDELASTFDQAASKRQAKEVLALDPAAAPELAGCAQRGQQRRKAGP